MATPMTLSEIAQLFGMKLTAARDEVEHAARSASPAKLQVTRPATCIPCEHVFKDRTKLTAPSRCPRCKSEQTTEPVFEIR